MQDFSLWSSAEWNAIEHERQVKSPLLEYSTDSKAASDMAGQVVVCGGRREKIPGVL